MTYKSTAADTPYTGNLYNLNPNTRSVLSILKASLKDAGFTIPQSGDGLATYAASDILTNENLSDPTVANPASNDGATWAKIANSICNNRAWFIAKPNAGATYTGEWCIQLISFAGTLDIRAKFSPGGFGVGTATNTPAPTTGSDEKYNCGGGTDASPTGTSFTLGTGDGSFRANTTFDDAVATPRGWLGLWANATDGCCLLFTWDFVGNLGGGDAYPYVTAVRGNTGSNDAAEATVFADQSTQQNTNGAVTKRGSGLAEYTSGLFPMATGLTSSGTVGSLGVNTLGSISDLIPVMYARCAHALASPAGWKGISTMLRWKASARPNGDHYEAPVGGAARDFVVIGGLVFPWAVPGTACLR